ncbi:hypothetical protein RF11_09303 [Thelohanellus kitauei]|uniref:Uncharacterized protein n=1 Tax=Thelohanellus kitauei TaxID=669202 RepID=A0A0C2J6V0_THEKT|nr:hypothetical protein RF11_09303 [Thelohanellus kitauei]
MAFVYPTKYYTEKKLNVCRYSRSEQFLTFEMLTFPEKCGIFFLRLWEHHINFFDKTHVAQNHTAKLTHMRESLTYFDELRLFYHLNVDDLNIGLLTHTCDMIKKISENALNII